MSDAISPRPPLAPWIAKMLTPAKLARWDDCRHRAYEQMIASQANAHPFAIPATPIDRYLRRISQGQD